MITDKEHHIITKNYKKRKQEKEKYDEYRKQKTEQGNDFQKLIEKLLKRFFDLSIQCFETKDEQYNIGENKIGLEIKYDDIIKETGNLFIEYAEKATKREGPYALGGILKNDNSWLYIIGDFKEIYCINIKTLRRMYEKNKKRTKYPWVENELKTSLGFLISKEKALKICLWWFLKNRKGWKLHINKKEITQKDIWKQ